MTASTNPPTRRPPFSPARFSVRHHRGARDPTAAPPLKTKHAGYRRTHLIGAIVADAGDVTPRAAISLPLAGVGLTRAL